MSEKIYLDVPFSEKEQVKALGTKWDPEVKRWFITSNPEKFKRNLCKIHFLIFFLFNFFF